MTALATSFRAPRVPTVDQIMAEERAGSFAKRSLKTSAKLAGLKLAVSMMDLTTLEGKDTPGKVAFLCRKALAPAEPRLAVPPCAAVCVYPNMVRHARQFLGADSSVKVAAVATGFPSGQYPLPTKLAEVRRAVADGADEIDMVIDRCAFLTGDHAKVHDEIAATKAACGPAHLKVIFETGELVTYDNVRLTKQMLDRNGWNRILLVSSPYHMRRATMTWSKLAPDVAVVPTPVPQSQFYTHERGASLEQIRGILHEYAALASYWWKGWV